MLGNLDLANTVAHYRCTVTGYLLSKILSVMIDLQVWTFIASVFVSFVVYCYVHVYHFLSLVFYRIKSCRITRSGTGTVRPGRDHGPLYPAGHEKFSAETVEDISSAQP